MQVNRLNMPALSPAQRDGFDDAPDGGVELSERGRESLEILNGLFDEGPDDDFDRANS